MRQDRLQELLGDVGVEQAVPVLRVGRVVPHRIVNAETDEPAKQQVVVELLHQLALGANGVERLDQRAAQQLLRRNRGPAERGVHLRELRIEGHQDLVHDIADHA
jgi:hypothetical protein